MRTAPLSPTAPAASMVRGHVPIESSDHAPALASPGLFEQTLPLSPLHDPDPSEARSRAIKGTIADKVRYTQDIAIGLPHWDRGFRLAESLIATAELVDAPSGGRYLGDGGTGKSFFISRLLRRYPTMDTALRYHAPVIAISLSDCKDGTSVRIAILRALHHPFVTRGTPVDELNEMIIEAVRACGTVLLLVDEAHHMWVMTASRRSEARAMGPIGEVFKWWYNTVKRPVIFLGNEGLERLFETDTQAETRWPQKLIFRTPPFGPESIGLYDAYDKALPMEDPAGLSRESVAKALYASTKNNFRKLSRLLVHSVILSAKAGCKRITPEHLAMAHELSFGAEDRNPFHGLT